MKTQAYIAQKKLHFTSKQAVKILCEVLQLRAKKIVEESDLSDLRYLFFYGEYIADDQWKMAQHLNSLSGETLQKIADAYTEGFRKGFEVAGKPLEKKRSVNIRYPVGFERMVKLAMENFRKMQRQKNSCCPVLHVRQILPGAFFIKKKKTDILSNLIFLMVQFL